MLLYREAFATEIFNKINNEYFEIIDGIKNDLNIEKSFRDVSAEFTFLDTSGDPSISAMPVNKDGMFTEYLHFYIPSTSDTSDVYLVFKLDVAGLVRLYMMSVKELKKGVVHVNRVEEC